MVTFGFSAFLKILSLNDKPQITAIKKRLFPSSGSGYDFHRRFRQLAHNYLVEGKLFPEVIASAHAITSAPERASAVAALDRLALWKAGIMEPVMGLPPAVFESPSHLFKVKFEPDFGMLIQGTVTAIHLWNTKAVKLVPSVTYAALSLVAQAYQDQGFTPDDIGVLSVREPPTLFRLSQVPDHSALATSLVDHIEDVIQGTNSPLQPPESRPSL